jgi:hypothetical protein
MKLRWKIAGGLVAALGVVAAVAFTVLRRQLAGPPPPQCRLPAPPRSAFGPSQQLSSRSTPGARSYDLEPTAALLPGGALAVVWNARDPIWKATSGLVAARLEADGRAEIRPLPDVRAEAFDAWMAAAGDGALHLVWLAHGGGRPEKDMLIAGATSTDGLSWSPARAVHAVADCPPAGRGCLDKPMVVAAGSGAGGSAVTLFYSTDESLRALPSGADQSIKVAGGAYAHVVRTHAGALLLAVADDRPAAPDKANAEEGRDAAFGSLGLQVSVLRSPDGGRTWEKQAPASAEGEPIPFFFSNPQVAVDEERGFEYVAYPTGKPDGAWTLRLATSADGGKSWSRITVNDDPPCASHMAPQLAQDPATGALYLTWLDNRTGQGALVMARCEPGGARCGPNQTINDAPFASYSYERHLPAWLSEYGALVLDEERRVLHSVWTQPVDEGGAATSRIFHAALRLPTP